MAHQHFRLCFSGAIALSAVFGTASVRAAALIPSPANDLLLASNGGVADINGSTVDGSANYSQLPAANLIDGDRDGAYGNGAGVDGAGSIAHTAAAAANQEMGVKLPAPTFIGIVDVFNRTDCCNARLDATGTVPFTVNILNGTTNVFTGDYTFTPSITQTAGNGNTAAGMVIPTNVIGDYVQIVQHNNEYMNLAEVEAYVPEPASISLCGLSAAGLLLRRRRAI